MIIQNIPALSPGEERMSLAKYYHIPLHTVGPLQRQILDRGPMDPADAIPCERWTEHLKLPGEYNKVTYGYCVQADGSGYIASCSHYAGATPEMIRWYFRWINIPFKSQPAGTGNLKYKIWCPPDHVIHGFLNGKDRSGGVYSIESVDLADGPKFYCLRTHLELTDFGMSEAELRRYTDAGVWIDPALEEFYEVDPEDYTRPGKRTGGSHLCLTMSRPCPTGGMEKVTSEWIGWTVRDGKIVRDYDTPANKLDNAFLKQVLVHTTTEAQQLGKFLPELYAAYHDKPDDVDVLAE